MRLDKSLFVLLLGLIAHLISTPGVESADHDRERQVMGRFLSVLERSPRRGTALDRVYGYHVERGELDALLKPYRDRVAKDPKDANAWMLIGLVESQRGRDALAVAAFRGAEEARGDDPLAPYYLGQALVLVGQPDLAVEAFERALTRKPTRIDLLEIFQALGRVHQRARRDDQALAVWSRLEKLFPDDPKVQEQVAATLAEESKLEPALARYEAMARSARDPFRKVRYRLEAADLEVKLGRQADALRDYESLLEGVDPESWIAREVRHKIEAVFTREDDQAGLARYYERRVEKSPDDIDAMTRLARALGSQGRSSEARGWLDRALKLAPSSKPLRLALIEQLANGRKFAEAAEQYEAMARLEPNNPDLVRDWGRMLLRDTSRPEAERKKAASEVWQGLVRARPDDPSTTAQVADLCRQAGLVDEAIALYRKAVGLAPESPQYREYLGEYYHQLKRPDEALAAWRGLADGPNRTPASFERLGEVLAGFGYKAEAIEAVDRAIRLDPASFPTRIRQAGLLLSARRFDEAEAQLVAAEPLADSEERREEWLIRRIEVDEAAGRVARRIESLKAEVAGPKATDLATWLRLARYDEAARRPVEATAAAEKAASLDESSIAAKVALTRLYEATGRFGEAADGARALATLDRRARAEHLGVVARLETRLGRKDQALKAGRDVLAASPGNPEALQAYADLCFQLGESEEGLDALRRAVRANESDVSALTRLAEALAREFRTEEAIELFWRAFEKSTDLDTRLGQVVRLAELHLRRNQFDRLTDRLARLQLEEGHRREGTLLLAQAHATLGDFGTARQQLEGLLEGNDRDTSLLKQLSKLSEDEGDTASALRFQKRLNEVASGREVANRLAQLAVRAGEIELAESIWAESGNADGDLSRTLGALASLSANGRLDVVLAITNRLLRSDPGNWELLYREARTLVSLGRQDEAATRYRAILALRGDDDEVGAVVKSRRKMAGRSTAVTSSALNENVGLRYRMLAMGSTISGAAGLKSVFTTFSANSWAPADYGQARGVALASELARARRSGTEAEWLAARGPATDPRAAWDNFYVALMVADPKAIYESARALVRVAGHDPRADFAFLQAMMDRNAPLGVQTARAIQDAGPDLRPPLPPDEVDLVRDALRTLLRARSTDLTGGMLVAATGELKRADRLAEFEADYRNLVDSANDHPSIAMAGYAAADRGDSDALRKVAEAFYRLPAGTRGPVPNNPPTYSVMTPQGVLPVPEYHQALGMKAMADGKRYGDILRLVDDELTAIREPGRAAQRARAAQAPSVAARNMYPSFAARNTSQQVDYPTPNRYLDSGSIVLLRAAWAYFKRDGKGDELATHLRQVAADASKDPASERYARLALSAVLWWLEGRDSAIKELARAVELTPGDVDLKLLTAELRATLKQPEEALAVVDSIEASDQDVTRRRELVALRLAVQVGKADRARAAAERLFGLRLDSATQVQLAAQMHQLGMHDLADAVLARTRRQVGNNAVDLLELMGQYQRQGNLEAASQVAMQLLRRSSGQALRLGVVEDPYQRQALAVLAGSGKLNEMITRVEGQVRTAPQSLALQQTLAVYYRAAGRLDKLKATNEALLRLRPEDTALRMQVATQLAQAGDLDSALEHYRAVFRHDPAMLSVYSTSIFNTFQQAKRTDELVKLLDQVGLKTFDDPLSIRTLIGSMLKDPKTFEPAVALLDKAWEAYPNDRALLLLPVALVETYWARPEAYERARAAVLPPEKAASVEPWAGLETLIANSGRGQDGRLITLGTRLLEASSRFGKLDDLAGSIEARLNRPEGEGWLGGRGLLALVRLRQGRIDEGRLALEKLLSVPDARPTFTSLNVLGQEVRDRPGFENLAIAIYERAWEDPRAISYAALSMKASAPWHLAVLDRKLGRAGEALAIARKVEEGIRVMLPSGLSSPVAAYRLIGGLSGLGTLYLEVGDPLDALRVFDELLSLTEEIRLARTYTVPETLPSFEVWITPAREGLSRILDGLAPETLATTIQALIRPDDPARPVDLRMVVHPREVDRASVRSLLGSALEQLARDPAALARTRADLGAIAKGRPGDLEALAAEALAASYGDDPGAVASLAATLDRLTDESPLPLVPPGTRPDVKKRDEAARRLGLWLVARRCWEHEATSDLGDRLATKALEAARRQLDPGWAMAMLRELGRRALDRGDRAGLEARWTALLDLIRQDPLASPSPPPSRPGQPPSRTRVPAFSVDRFRQAAEFASLAAENGLIDLSLLAVRESLKGGPPVVPVALATASAVRVATSAASTEPPPDPTTVLVEAKLVGLDALWTRAKVPPEAAYETLRDAVLPPSRPAEVFAYDPSLNAPGRPTTGGPGKPGEVALILARRAAQAGRLDDLRRRLAERQDSPASRDAARKLLAAVEEAAKIP